MPRVAVPPLAAMTGRRVEDEHIVDVERTVLRNERSVKVICGTRLIRASREREHECQGRRGCRKHHEHPETFTHLSSSR